MIRKLSFASAAIFCMSPAFAGDEIVSFDHQKLGDPAYMQELNGKVRSAAKKACEKELKGTMLRHYALKTCIKDTMDDAKSAIEAKRLAALSDEAESGEKLASLE